MEPTLKDIINYIQEYRLGNEVDWGASILVALAGFKAYDLVKKAFGKDNSQKQSKLESEVKEE